MVLDLKDRLVELTFIISDFDPVDALYPDILHLIGDGMIALSGKTIDAGSHYEMGFDLFGGTE
jgi:hypothetical protein